jgi:PPP family 3-phenylpropionic acid transporter
MAPIIPLIDNSVLESLGVQSARYGKIRLWGSVGWGLAAPPVGLFLEWAGLHWGFYLCAGGMLVLLAVSFRLPLGQPDVTHRFWAGLRLLLVNWQWPVFLLVVFIGGAGLSIIHNYLFLFVAQLGGSKSLMGAALSIATISELGIMFFSNPLLTRWRARTLLYVALLTLAVRGLAYAYTQAPWPVLVIQLLHGPSFALLWIAGVAHAHRIAPPGLKATAQGLFFGVTTGLGGAFGAIAGGWLYESLGLAVMFWWIGLGMLACLLLFIAAGALRRRPL